MKILAVISVAIMAVDAYSSSGEFISAFPSVPDEILYKITASRSEWKRSLGNLGGMLWYKWKQTHKKVSSSSTYSHNHKKYTVASQFLIPQ